MVGRCFGAQLHPGENSASLSGFAILESVKTLSSPDAAILESAGEYDLEPVPSEWTDSLLERLDALECACASSGCVCEKAAYIRQRTSPAMGRNQFIELARTTGLGHLEAEEYYRNYLVDIRYIQNSERMHELADEIRKSREMLLPAMSPDAVRPVLERYNNASDEFDALAKHIYEPLSL